MESYLSTLFSIQHLKSPFHYEINGEVRSIADKKVQVIALSILAAVIVPVVGGVVCLYALSAYYKFEDFKIAKTKGEAIFSSQGLPPEVVHIICNALSIRGLLNFNSVNENSRSYYEEHFIAKVKRFVLETNQEVSFANDKVDGIQSARSYLRKCCAALKKYITIIPKEKIAYDPETDTIDFMETLWNLRVLTLDEMVMIRKNLDDYIVEENMIEIFEASVVVHLLLLAEIEGLPMISGQGEEVEKGIRLLYSDACFYGQVKRVKVLLNDHRSKQEKLFYQTLLGHTITSIELALTNRDIELLELLLTNRERVTKNDWGILFELNDPEIMKVFAEQGEMFAKLRLIRIPNFLEVVQKLIDVSISQKAKNQAFRYAVEMVQFDAVQLLANNGADLNCTDEKGWGQPLDIALRSFKHPIMREIFDFLYSRGARFTQQEAFYLVRRLFEYYVENAQDIQWIIDHGFDVRFQDTDSLGYRDTLLHVCVSKQDIQTTIPFLLQQGLDINVLDKLGNTPLHRLAKFQSKERIELLLANGADLTITNNKGETPLVRFQSFHGDKLKPEIIALLTPNT